MIKTAKQDVAESIAIKLPHGQSANAYNSPMAQKLNRFNHPMMDKDYVRLVSGIAPTYDKGLAFLADTVEVRQCCEPYC